MSQTQEEDRAEREPLPADGAEPEAAQAKHRSFWRELPVLIVVAFGIALLIKTFALQAFYIPSASMEPTLRIGDRVLVEKVSYRFGQPSRGDVVVFEKDLAQVVSGAEGPDEPFWIDIANAFRDLFGFPTGTSQDFIKRVIAVEGDIIEGRDGKVYVNNDLVEETYLPGDMQTGNFGPQTIPEGMIWVMGDNRNNSDDSRNFGPIPVNHVVGQAFLLIWPPADFAAL
ncbi:MAG: signal peptidase I [Actinomycetota bacterium]